MAIRCLPSHERLSCAGEREHNVWYDSWNERQKEVRVAALLLGLAEEKQTLFLLQ